MGFCFCFCVSSSAVASGNQKPLPASWPQLLVRHGKGATAAGVCALRVRCTGGRAAARRMCAHGAYLAHSDPLPLSLSLLLYFDWALCSLRCGVGLSLARARTNTHPLPKCRARGGGGKGKGILHIEPACTSFFWGFLGHFLRIFAACNGFLGPRRGP